MKYRSHPGATKRVSLYLPTDVIARVKTLAAEADISFSASLLTLIEERLKQKDLPL